MIDLLRKIRRKKAKRPAPDPAPGSIVEAAGDLPDGHETVLVVEDEEAVREYLAVVLRELGYTVLQAANGEEALRIVQRQRGKTIDLLLTDIVMPRMGGKELVYRMASVSPRTKVMFSSAYPEKLATDHGMIDHQVPFLQKPVRPRTLALTVRQTLDQPERAGAEKPPLTEDP